MHRVLPTLVGAGKLLTTTSLKLTTTHLFRPCSAEAPDTLEMAKYNTSLLHVLNIEHLRMWSCFAHVHYH